MAELCMCLAVVLVIFVSSKFEQFEQFAVRQKLREKIYPQDAL